MVKTLEKCDILFWRKTSRKFIIGRCIFPRALKYLKEAVDYQEKVLDTQDELIHTHQAMSIALRALGRDEEAEEEMNRAGECARKLDSWEAPLDKMRTQERESEWIDILSAKPRDSAL